ncbi:MAG: glycoside hydrolase family 1 protein [Candidatus Dormibacteria bacterium]
MASPPSPDSGTLRIPQGFLLGTSSAAHQVEGGLWNDWMRMERDEPWRIKDGASAAVAIDHFHRYRDDLEMLARMGHTAQRFSVEWARVEPEPGRFDVSALRHYARVTATCRELGMEPVVTLHHFTLPVWLADRGGLLDPEAPRLFARYAAACAESFGREVRWWVTINEPNVLFALAYAEGRWPPHRQSMVLALRAGVGLLRMHAAAATALHQIGGAHGWQTMVSVAHHERPFRPRPGSVAARLLAWLPGMIFNRWFLASCVRGCVLPPAGTGQRVPGLRGSLDYLGLNYYAEEQVRFDRHARTRLFVGPDPELSLPRNSLGWPIDAGGLRRALVALAEERRLPLLITENGVADEDDELRPWFVADHLRAVMEAIAEGADVRGYLYWTGFDNFEWLEGYGAKFGLVAVDRDTLERRPKPSAELFADICRTGVIRPVGPPRAAV